jgi:putative transposase
VADPAYAPRLLGITNRPESSLGRLVSDVVDIGAGIEVDVTWTPEIGPGCMRVLIRPDWAGDFTMKRTRHSAEQIIRKLKTAEQLIAQGKTVVEVCRVIEVTQPTYHRWRQQYGGMQAEEARRLSQLEKENARLKKLLAEAELEKAMLKDLAEGNF